MSPEQIRGETCDIRSDLYSLGIVFFEILTGRRPFENESSVGIQMAHLTTAPPSVLSYAPKLPPECDSIVQKLIAKRPEDRYQNSAELLAELTRRGANSHAGDLRPVIDTKLAEIIARIEEIPHDNPQPAPSAHVPIAGSATQVANLLIHTKGAATAAPQTAEVPVVVEHPILTQAITQPTRPPKSKLPMLLGIAAIVLLLLAAAAWMLRSRNTETTKIAPGGLDASAGSIYSDDHGRMVLVPAGAFQFSQRQQPAQTVSLPAFYIDETEVSRAEYHRFCTATGHAVPAGFDLAANPNYPVSNVSYKDAAAYAAWAGRRLPTEQEWEKAARGTDSRTFPWGNAAWTDNVPGELQPVTSEPLRKSPYGAFNMAGNVWEWTATPYTPAPMEVLGIKRLLKDFGFSPDWRTTKGGSFAAGSKDGFDISAARGLPSNLQSMWVGFRCVRNAH